MSNLTTMTDKALSVYYTILSDSLRHVAGRYSKRTPDRAKGLWKMYEEAKAEWNRRRALY